MPVFRKAFCCCFFLLFILVGCESQEPSSMDDGGSGILRKIIQPSSFISATDYLVMHPEQIEMSRRFSQIVQNGPVPLTEPNGDKISIAFIYPGEQASDYWRRSVSSFVRRMDELNIKYVLQEFFSRGGAVDVLKQEQQLREALAEDPDYLVFTLEVSSHMAFIERILARGRPKLILQNITTPLAVWEDNQPYYVGFDHVIGTRKLADYFLGRYSSEDTFGMLYYSKGYVSEMRGDSFIRFMHGEKGPQLCASYFTDGQVERAERAVIDMLKHNNPSFIYACSTDVALGAVKGLKGVGRLAGIAVNGWGGGSAELEAMAAGELDVTVMRMNDDNGVAMAEIIRLNTLGKGKDVPTVFSGEFALVTRETPPDVLIDLKKRAFRYSGSQTGN